MNWIDKGNKFYKEGEYEDSLNCYKKALENDPSNVEALYNKALIHIMHGEYEESLDTSNRLVKIVQTDPHSWKLKGFALFNLKNYREAVDAFNEAIKLKPDDSYAWNNKGSALCNLVLLEEASESNNKESTSCNPDLLKEAIESFEKAFSLDSRYVNALKNKEKILSIKKQNGSKETDLGTSKNQNLLLSPEETYRFRSYFKLAGFSTDLDPGPEMICPVASCSYRAKLRIKGQRCPEHGVKLRIAGS